MTRDRSPEFCFKRLICKYLLETGNAPGDLLDGSYLAQSHNLSIFKCDIPGGATYQISGLYA